MVEFWYDYINPSYQGITNLCCMDADSFKININTKDVLKDIADGVEKRIDTSNYEITIGKNKKLNGLMKEE